MSELPAAAPATVQVLPGAIRAGHDAPGIAGPVIADLLRDVMPTVDALLFVGPVDVNTIGYLSGRSRSCTVLVRSHSDARQLTGATPTNLEVIAGSLSAFAAADHRSFDAIVAVDGLDHVSELNGMVTPWADSFTALTSRLNPGGTLVLGAPNPARLDTLLTVPTGSQQAPAGLGHDDAHRPSSLQALRAAFVAAGFPVTSAHCGFGVPSDLHTLVNAQTLADGGPGTLTTGLVQRALEVVGVTRPRVLSPAALVQRLALAGSLPSAASAWIVVVGGAGRSAYLREGDDALWLDAAGSQLITGGHTRRRLPSAVPSTVSAEHLLLQHVAAARTEQFRELAARLGSWMRESVASFTGDSVAFDDVFADGDGFVRGLGLDRGETAESSTSSAVLLDRAWRRFASRLAASEYQSPWPDTLSERQLVQLWLSMSGVTGSVDDLTAAPPAAAADDLRSRAEQTQNALDRAQTLSEELDVMAALLADRDTSLQLREARIRRLRAEVLKQNAKREEAVAARAALTTGRTYKLARRMDQVADLRDPKKLARVALKRADGAIRAYRRMR